MEYVLRQLSVSIVLSKDDISAIKENISRQYARQTKEMRAYYLAQALHKAVEKALLGIDFRFWQTLKQQLFKNTLAKQKSEITKRDVFHEIVNLDVAAEELNDYTFRWLLNQQVDGVDSAELSAYIRRHMILHGKDFTLKASGKTAMMSKREATTWLAIDPKEPEERSVSEKEPEAIEIKSEIPLVESVQTTEAEKPVKAVIKSLEPAPHFTGEEDWPVSYKLSHLSWAFVCAAVLMGASMLVTLLK